MSQPTPREILKAILHGNVPERPLVVPIVFSLGARVENLPLRTYLENPTKITNALLQIRTQWRTDGVSCYFDPLLEAEALGGSREWDETGRACGIRWPGSARRGELPDRLRAPEEAVLSPRVRTAVEVIRRLKSLLRDEPLLMVGVNGPFTLAARLNGIDPGAMRIRQEPSASALEAAAAAITRIASAFVEAGANLIFIREESLPSLSVEACEQWATLLAPLFNILRFYEALPVLQIPAASATSDNVDAMWKQSWDAVLCAASEEFAARVRERGENFVFGCAVPLDALDEDDASGTGPPELSGMRSALVTTDGDVPATADLKRLMGILDSIGRRS